MMWRNLIVLWTAAIVTPLQCDDESCSLGTSNVKFDYVESKSLDEPVAHLTSYTAATYRANEPNEDRYKVHIEGNSVLASVLDGHGGWQVSQYINDHLVNNTKKNIDIFNPSNEFDEIKRGLETAFLDTESNLKDILLPAFKLGFGQVNRVGACTLMAYFNGNSLTIANAGDVRAVLGTRNSEGQVIPKQLSNDHNAKHNAEQERLAIEHPNESNLVVCKSPNACYVKGGLQPTRALGDFAFKYPEFNSFPARASRGGGRFISEPYTPPYILTIPEIQTHELTENDQFLILGSDGLWDDVTNEEAVQIVQHYHDLGLPDRASEALIEQVLSKTATSFGVQVAEVLAVKPGQRRNVHDDTTVVVLYFSS